jgi:hypothetical protein
VRCSPRAGARSRLDSAAGLAPGGGAAGSGGAGGGGESTGGAGSGGGTGAGGEGGSTLSCPSLVQAVLPIGTTLDPTRLQTEPALALTAAGEAVLAFGMPPAQSSGPTPTPIGDAAPVPWFSWPADLGPAFIAASDGGHAFQAATGDGGGVALFLNPREDPPFGKMYLSPQVAPATATSGLGNLIATNDSDTSPLFLARGPARMLAGSLYNGPGSSQLGLSVVEGGKLVTESFITSGCAVGPVVASGIPVGDGFLAAFSSDRPFGDCASPGPLGPANRVQVARWSPSQPGTLLPGDELVVFPDDQILQVAIVPRSDGAWVLWQVAGTEFPNPPIFWRRVDPFGKKVGVEYSTFTPAGSTGGFAAGAIGDGLALAYVDSTDDPGKPSIGVGVFDGELVAVHANVHTQFEWVGTGRLAILGAPSADRVLVAWSTGPLPSSSYVTRVLVVRLDCVPK